MSAATGSALIRITRFCPISRELLARYGVYLDGQLLGDSPRRRKTEFSVPAGSHTLQVRGRRFMGEPSNELELDLESGSVRTFECRTKSRLGGLTDKEAQAIERRDFHWVRLYETDEELPR